MKVIYIDDDAVNRQVLRGMLGTAGVPMTEAADAKAGLRMLEEGGYALVLMDLRMPEINGLTAIRQLRARQDANRKIPILVVTADLTPGVRELCREAGADGFLEKPVAMQKLFDTIGTVMTNAGTPVLS